MSISFLSFVLPFLELFLVRGICSDMMLIAAYFQTVYDERRVAIGLSCRNIPVFLSKSELCLGEKRCRI